MPAIQPARLRQQAALLAQHLDEPAAFVRSLHHLLDFYADRAHRPGQAGAPSPLLSAYRVRPPVLRMLVLEMAPLVQAHPQPGLALCDALWAEPFLEFRQLASELLGRIPPKPPEPVIQRVRQWGQSDSGQRMVTELLERGMERVRREAPEALLKLAEDWLAAPKPLTQQLGLRLLLPLIRDENYQNLPVFFRLLQPLARQAPSVVRPDLLDALRALAQRSPRETAFFLRQTLTMPNNPDTAWVIRQCAAAFPPELEETLRASVRRA